MNWDAIVRGARRTLTRALASSSTITYTSVQALGSVDLTGRALFRARAPRIVTLATGEAAVQGEQPELGVSVDDLPGGVCNQNDEVVIVGDGGGTFRVVHKLEDGEGALTLVLEEV